MADRLEATLGRDNSDLALDLQKKLEDQGYNIEAILQGSSKPVFITPSQYLTGYENILKCVIKS